MTKIIFYLLIPLLFLSCMKVDNSIKTNFTANIPTPSPTPSPTPVVPEVCPTNFIEVPALAPYTAENFCIAKYEMKITGVADGNQVYSAAFVPESRASGTPWVNVSRTNADAECRSLGPNYRLVANDEWQTLARNIEVQSWNWGGNTVANAAGISRSLGMSGGVSAAADTAPCDQTGHTCDLNSWDSFRRVHKLSNGKYIWDFGGNVAEWMRDRVFTTPSNSPITQIGLVATQFNFGPSGTYTSLNSEPFAGLGEVRGVPDNGTLIRSGAWGVGVTMNNNAGVFAAATHKSENDVDISVGFRCAFQPTPATTQTIFQSYILPTTPTTADATALELGTKFVPEVNGTITAVRFYRGAGSQNVAGFTVNLWSAGGGNIGTGSGFEGTLPGWQEINLTTPVAVTAGTTYVASYYTSNGLYANTSNAFLAKYPGRFDLTALPTGGVYNVGAGFPTSSYNDANYFVDVKFTPDP